MKNPATIEIELLYLLDSRKLNIFAIAEGIHKLRRNDPDFFEAVVSPFFKIVREIAELQDRLRVFEEREHPMPKPEKGTIV